MKTKKTLFLLLILGISTVVISAQELTLTTTAANTVSSKSSIDMPGLTGNPLAIIVATPIGNTAQLNPHPIGAWYYSGKWNIFNTDHAVMPIGAKYRVQFFQQPGPNQFLHTVTQQNLGSEGSYIDNPMLNNNPNSLVQILQNYAPEVRTPYYLNRFEAKAAYSPAAGRWYIANINGEPLGRGTVYSIVLGSSGPVGSNTNTNPNSNPGNPIPVNPNPGGTVASTNPPQNPPAAQVPTPTPLKGFVDMHTHPMSHLGFGKRLLYGAPDIGSIVPAGTRNCNPEDFRATNINEALGNCTSAHGGWGINNTCGDHMRALVLSNLLDKEFVNRVSGNAHGDHQHAGSESNPFNFQYFPHQSSKIHQQMWWEWLERAVKVGNLRVMVALAVNSETLADILNGDNPKDDKASADLQIDEIKLFVGRHSEFMEIAYTSTDLRRIVGQGKLAVVLGMEVDNLGNFNKLGVDNSQAAVITEILRLYGKGVRYIFPIHLSDNKFGGTAVYDNLFNFANKRLTGSFYQVDSGPVAFRLGITPGGIGDFATLQTVKTAMDAMSGTPYPPAYNGDPTSPDFCPAPILGCWKTFRLARSLLTPDPGYLIYPGIPGGHVNKYGLTDLGKVAVKEMMRMGMLIDIDHMSDKSQDDTLRLAEQFGYPVNIGHNGLQNSRDSERIASIANVQRVARLGGVFGVGTADSDKHPTDAVTVINSFNAVWATMAGNGGTPRVAIGTDVNGMERLPRASPGLSSGDFYSGFTKSKTGNHTWDYTKDGVAHYGLIADFMRDISRRSPTVYDNLMNSAEYFAQMWEKAERQKSAVK